MNRSTSIEYDIISGVHDELKKRCPSIQWKNIKGDVLGEFIFDPKNYDNQDKIEIQIYYHDSFIKIKLNKVKKVEIPIHDPLCDEKILKFIKWVLWEAVGKQRDLFFNKFTRIQCLMDQLDSLECPGEGVIGGWYYQI